MILLAVSLLPLAAAPASACPYGPATTASTSGDARTVAATVDATAATHCAKSGALVGANCSYSTGSMARRVVEEGGDWSYTGTLATSEDTLESHVACPFVTTSDRAVHVVANELLEVITSNGHAAASLRLEGKTLEVDGVHYVVLTSFHVVNA